MDRGEERYHPPREAARLLGIPPSTLRTYATEFATLLSTEAGPIITEGSGRSRHRRYTDEDLVTLRRIKDLLEAGLSYEVARRQLGVRSAGRVERRRRRPTERRLAPPDVLSPAPGEPAPQRSAEPPAPIPEASGPLIELIRSDLARLTELSAHGWPHLASLEARLAALTEAVQDPAAYRALAEQLDRIEQRLARLEAIPVALDRITAGEPIRRLLDRIDERLARLEEVVAEETRTPHARGQHGWWARIFRRG